MGFGATLVVALLPDVVRKKRADNKGRHYVGLRWRTSIFSWLKRSTRHDPSSFGRLVAFYYLIRVRSSPPQIPSQQPSILMLDGPVSIRFPE